MASGWVQPNEGAGDGREEGRIENIIEVIVLWLPSCCFSTGWLSVLLNGRAPLTGPSITSSLFQVLEALPPFASSGLGVAKELYSFYSFIITSSFINYFFSNNPVCICPLFPSETLTETLGMDGLA